MNLDTIRRRIASIQPVQRQHAEPKASVAVILREGGGGPEVLLIERAARLGDPWSGQMAFPGGHRNSGESLLETAIRETMEEVAIDLRPHELLGPLCDVPTHKTGLVVRPYVFALTAPATATPHMREVADVLWMPILPMMRGELSGTYDFRPEGVEMTITLPCFRVPDPKGTGFLSDDRTQERFGRERPTEGSERLLSDDRTQERFGRERPTEGRERRVVWGLTHRMLEALFEVIR